MSRGAGGAQFTISEGARAGRVHRLTKEFLTVGRHPTSDLQFDPGSDLDVSTRHAAIFRQDDGWCVRDLGSTNGTYVNGHRVRHDRPLQPGDVLRFGANGPHVTFDHFHGSEQSAAVVSPPRAVRAEVAPRAVRRALPREGPTTLRIRREVSRQAARFRWIAGGALALALGIGGIALWRNAARTRGLEAQRDRLLTQVDSLARALGSASTQAATIQAEVNEARRSTLNLRAAIVASGTDQERLRDFDAQVANVLVQQGALLRAATLDASTVTTANADAMALVLAQFSNGRSFSATGFTLASRGDTGWVVTNKHVVVDSNGAPAARTGVVYHGTSQNFRAEIVAVHDSADLALLRIVVRAGVPAIRGTTTTEALGPGTPVALLSFPLGLDLPMGGAWTRVGISVSTFTGTVSRVLPNLIQLDGYGAAGSSGSPVFNAAGEVVGIVYGGERGTGGRILYAAPVRQALEMLAQVGAPTRGATP